MNLVGFENLKKPQISGRISVGKGRVIPTENVEKSNTGKGKIFESTLAGGRRRLKPKL